MRYKTPDKEIKEYPLKEIMKKYGLCKATVRRIIGIIHGRTHIFSDIPVKYSTYVKVSEAIGEWIMEVEEKRRGLLNK